MAINVGSPPETNGSTLSGLVGGIVTDFQDLVKQQAELVRTEIREDLHKTKQASLSIAIGFGVGLLAAIVLCLTLVHLLDWAVPQLPLWACYAIVGGALALVGGGLILAGKRKFASFNPLPDQSLEGFKENLRWQTTPR